MGGSISGSRGGLRTPLPHFCDVPDYESPGQKWGMPVEGLCIEGFRAEWDHWHGRYAGNDVGLDRLFALDAHGITRIGLVRS